jgi:quercetin dioxygenase-like cupin family protein
MSDNLLKNYTESMCEWAESYAIGPASLQERERFEQHLQECSACRSRLEVAVETLNQLAPPASLSPEARARFIGKLRNSNNEDSKPETSREIVFAVPGLFAKRTSQMEWQPAGIEGVSVKILFQDEALNYRTSLVKLESGARYSAHKHAGVEELYVLEGDLHYDVGVLVAGDYCSGESGTFHSVSHTENGCVLLVRASCEDEILASSHKTEGR